ncbi:uncharacterized protein KY384_006266 [Bacidia gigantensis]|uniref:uncharacterized protein n=1 Tax=Bacidia gigantensis TaxID=2732470 RepID=UPI001D057ED1|nr:uncharacterized protein KY384_006266 [Bacidia gigantensis]KAG8528579.1 hypothetical protein KY384_006266 [Bacidia gigantensis]
MEALPCELVDAIIDDVIWAHPIDRSALRNLRLVNKYFANATAPFLFRYLSVWIGVDSLRRLTDLSNTTEIAQYVQCINFSTLRLDNVDHVDPVDGLPEPMRRGFRDYFPESKTSSGHLFELLDNREWPSEIYRDLDILYDTETGQKIGCEILRRAFRRLPNVIQVNLFLSSHAIGANDVKSVISSSDGKDYCWDPEKTFPLLLQAIGDLPNPLRDFRLLRHHIAQKRGPQEDLADKDPLTTGLRSLRDFTDSTHWQGLEDLNLRFLDVGYHEEDTDAMVSLYNEVVVSVVTRAPALQDLMLSFAGSFRSWFGEAEERLSKSLSHLHLKTLREFRVDGATWLDVTGLLGFFNQYASTLVLIDIECVEEVDDEIMGGTQIWVNFLRDISKISFAALDALRITLSDLNADFEASDYVLGITDTNPIELLFPPENDSNEDGSADHDTDSEYDDAASSQFAEYDTDPLGMD